MQTILEADYLIVGAGGMAMAFTDTIISETDATVVIVDRYHQPGGHWTTAYPFVRLRRPSAFYGVNSRPLGSDQINQVGWNTAAFTSGNRRRSLRLFRPRDAAAVPAVRPRRVFPDSRIWATAASVRSPSAGNPVACAAG